MSEFGLHEASKAQHSAEVCYISNVSDDTL